MHGFIIKGSAFAVLAVIADGISQDHIEDVKVLGALVLAIVGIVAWIDGRIRKSIKEHAETDAQKYALLTVEIKHLRELMVARIEVQRTGEFKIHGVEGEG